MKMYMIFLLFMIQCSSESRKESELSLETWRRSALEAVVTTNRLEDFQKEILINQINGISQDNFDKLINRLSIRKSSNIHLILYYSEGEVVTEWFGGVIADNDSVNFAYLDARDMNNVIVVKSLSTKFINALLNTEELGGQMFLDRIIIRSSISEKGNILSQVRTLDFDMN